MREKAEGTSEFTLQLCKIQVKRNLHPPFHSSCVMLNRVLCRTIVYIQITTTHIKLDIITQRQSFSFQANYKDMKIADRHEQVIIVP
jgi:hypothetical protein